MSEDNPSETTTILTSEPSSPACTSESTPMVSSPADSLSKTQSAIQALSSILPSTPDPSLSTASSLLHDPDVASQISSLLRKPDSGAGDNDLCRWLYDTFQSGDSELQLVVLRFFPIIAGLYLSRIALRKHLAGFEAILLALYAHETTSRGGQPVAVNIPDLSHPSLYHETNTPIKNNATELNIAILSPTLEPYGTVRSTKRARIVGVGLELYFSKIFWMPVGSKIDFCEFCVVWAGQDGDACKESGCESSEQLWGGNGGSKRVGKEGRIPLPWELLQPVLRILGHCLMGTRKHKELLDAALEACRNLYTRSVNDINPKAILATGSLLRLRKMAMETADDFDPTEIQKPDVLSI